MSAKVQTVISKARVRRVNGAYALITDRPIATGEVVFVLEGEIIEHPSKYSVQIGERRHLEPLSPDPSDVNSLIHFFNHSCDPSTRIDFEDLTVRALRDLEPGEEVTFNYNTTEYEMANPFNCNCNGKNCVGYISGFKHLPVNRRMELISQLAPYLRVTT
jgi:SET domain